MITNIDKMYKRSESKNSGYKKSFSKSINKTPVGKLSRTMVKGNKRKIVLSNIPGDVIDIRSKQGKLCFDTDLLNN